MKKYLILFVSLLALSACNQEEVDRLAAENEQLKAALGESNSFADEMNDKFGQINVLLDSIESAESKLAVHLTEGTSYDNYTDRLRNVKEYIESSKKEIAKLESALAKSKNTAKIFTGQIERLKKTVEEREASIVELSAQVEKYREENKTLIKTVDLQDQEIMAQSARINEAKKEMAMLEARLEALRDEAKKAQADAYFAQAEGQEELAAKTKLAPKKKKEYLQQAYDLYKKSFEAGRTEAYKKMEALEAELK